MSTVPPLRLPGLVLLLLVLAAAGGARAWYLTTCVDPASGEPHLYAQDRPSKTDGGQTSDEAGGELGELTDNLVKDQAFRCTAPLAAEPELTAHVAPGYPWLVSLVQTWTSDPPTVIRWAQVALGALTAGLYFLWARRAFHSRAVALLAGLFCACHPFWVINSAELADGVLATFALAACLLLGTRAGQEGEAFTSLLFGLALAGLALVRAALLPFSLVALLWFLANCRTLRRGWLCALLAFLGLANGLAPWTVRNFRTFDEVVPVADSCFLHLWEGNNKLATGGPQDEKTRRQALSAEQLQAVLAEPTQPRRYNLLARPLADDLVADPVTALERRGLAAQYFLVGQDWAGKDQPGQAPTAAGGLPPWLADNYLLLLVAPLAGMLGLGLLGWRWTYPWRRHAMLATLAVVWVPLPYILGHAEHLWGPRLPLDGVLLCLAAFALVRLLPGWGRRLAAGPPAVVVPRLRV